MKKLLIFILLVAPLSMRAQNFSNERLKPIDDHIGIFFPPEETRFDTIKCIMLITGCKNCTSQQIDGFNIIKTTIKRRGQDMDIYYMEDRSHSMHIKYLNENKKELSDDITVWMSK